MKTYYVESYAAWFLVNARSIAAAKSEGVKVFGRGMVKKVRLATAAEKKYFINLTSEIGEAG
jgi:hypothetical protein